MEGRIVKSNKLKWSPEQVKYYYHKNVCLTCSDRPFNWDDIWTEAARRMYARRNNVKNLAGPLGAPTMVVEKVPNRSQIVMSGSKLLPPRLPPSQMNWNQKYQQPQSTKSNIDATTTITSLFPTAQNPRKRPHTAVSGQFLQMSQLSTSSHMNHQPHSAKTMIQSTSRTSMAPTSSKTIIPTAQNRRKRPHTALSGQFLQPQLPPFSHKNMNMIQPNNQPHSIKNIIESTALRTSMVPINKGSMAPTSSKPIWRPF